MGARHSGHVDEILASAVPPTPDVVSRLESPFDVILEDHVVGVLDVADLLAARAACRPWRAALGQPRTLGRLVERDATVLGQQPPIGFREALDAGDVTRAWCQGCAESQLQPLDARRGATPIRSS